MALKEVAVVLYFVGTPESALMIERVGFAGDKLIRVEEHPPDANHCQLGTVCVAVPDDVDLYQHGVVNATSESGNEWLLSPNFLNRFPRARWS